MLGTRIKRLPVVQRSAYLLSLVKRDDRVLHVGCTGWPSTEQRLAGNSLFHSRLDERCEVYGIDISQEGLRLLESAGYERIYEWDAMDLADFPERDFDWIIAGDVIEHVSNPGRLLDSARFVLADHGKLALSTANAFSAQSAIKLLGSYESVHPEHVAYYSQATLDELLDRHGFSVLDGAYSYEIGWRGPFGSVVHRSAYYASRLLTMFFPFYAEGIIRIARPTVSPGTDLVG